MTRAMTLIKMYFVGSLKALAADILKRLAEKVICSVPFLLFEPDSNNYLRKYQTLLRYISSIHDSIPSQPRLLH